jgi:hypothetical protein
MVLLMAFLIVRLVAAWARPAVMEWLEGPVLYSRWSYSPSRPSSGLLCTADPMADRCGQGRLHSHCLEGSWLTDGISSWTVLMIHVTRPPLS